MKTQNKYRRVFTVIFCAVFSVLGLTACMNNPSSSAVDSSKEKPSSEKTTITLPLKAFKYDPLSKIKPDDKDLTRQQYDDNVRTLAKKFIEFGNLPENRHLTSDELFHAFTKKYPEIAKIQTPSMALLNYVDKINKVTGSTNRDISRAAYYNLPVASEILAEDKMLVKETLKNGILVEVKENGNLALTDKPVVTEEKEAEH